MPTDTRTAFVAKLNNDGAAIERFNYRNLETITLNTLYGNDYVASDDTLAVVYSGAVPDTFGVGKQPVVEGRFDAASGVFQADSIIVKCASKAQPGT